MPNSGRVNWYGEDVRIRISEATKEGLLRVGFQVEAQTKVNITTNGQVDTGFMRNSVYTTDGGANSTYGNGGGGEDMAPEASPGDGVAVGVGANYAIYQETKNSFLYRAVEQVAGTVAGAEIQQAAKDAGLT